jgi:hypothetical protein
MRFVEHCYSTGFFNILHSSVGSGKNVVLIDSNVNAISVGYDLLVVVLIQQVTLLACSRRALERR